MIKNTFEAGCYISNSNNDRATTKEAVASLNYALFNLAIEEAIASLSLQQWISQIKRRLLEALKLN